MILQIPSEQEIVGALSMEPVFKALKDAAHSGEPVCLGVVTGSKGSSPQKAGAKAVFYADGRIVGTLGGGCLEAEAQRRALQSLRTGRAQCLELLLDDDFGWDDGLLCGGKVELLILPNAQSAGEQFWAPLEARTKSLHWGITLDHELVQWQEGSKPAALAYGEKVQPPYCLWIAGAGHIARAVAPLASQLDFDVTVMDDRPALVTPAFFPPPVRLAADTWESLLAKPLPDHPCFALVVTRGHRHDALVLREWIRKPFLFIAMIGSSRKASTVFAQFLQEKLATAEELARVACPAGVPIKSRTVMEIAVSIMAQFVDKRAQYVTPNFFGECRA